MKIKLPTNTLNSKPSIISITEKLNRLIDNSSNFFYVDENRSGKRIFYSDCSNSVYHCKLLGLIMLFFASRYYDEYGFVSIGCKEKHEAGYILIEDCSKFDDFLNSITPLESVKIEL